MVLATRNTNTTNSRAARQQEPSVSRPSTPNIIEEVQDFDLEQLSLESRLIVKAITIRFNIRFDEKDRQIEKLKEQVEALCSKMEKQEGIIEHLQQEKIKDTMVLSGNVPVFSVSENCSEIVAKTLREKIHTNIRTTDIIGAIRLGAPKQADMVDQRPIKFKFKPGNTDHRKNVQMACATVKPNIYINELMTSYKKDLFYEVRKIKKDAPGVIKSCYVSNGRIVIKRPDGRNIKVMNRKELDNFLQEVRLPVPNRIPVAT